MSERFEIELAREDTAKGVVGNIKAKIKEVAESKGVVVELTDTPLTALQKIQDLPASKLPQVVDKSIKEIHASDLSGATHIGYYAFEECRELSFLELPDTINAIERHAFDGCNALPSVVIPSNVTRLGDGAFANCTSLNIVRFLSNTPAELGSGVFNNTDPTLRIYVPSGAVDNYKSKWVEVSGKIFASPQ